MSIRESHEITYLLLANAANTWQSVRPVARGSNVGNPIFSRPLDTVSLTYAVLL